MNEIVTSAAVYTVTGVLTVLGTAGTMLVRAGLKRIENYVAAHFDVSDAAKINALLDVIDRVAEAAVQDANGRIVIGLKQHHLFTADIAQSLKQAVLQDVLQNLGALQQTALDAGWPLEQTILHAIEKHVLQNKPYVEARVLQAQQTKPAA